MKLHTFKHSIMERCSTYGS